MNLFQSIDLFGEIDSVHTFSYYRLTCDAWGIALLRSVQSRIGRGNVKYFQQNNGSCPAFLNIVINLLSLFFNVISSNADAKNITYIRGMCNCLEHVCNFSTFGYLTTDCSQNCLGKSAIVFPYKLVTRLYFIMFL